MSFVVEGKIPNEKIFGKNPNYDNLKDYGCLCFVSNSKRERHKFLQRAQKCIFIGYSTNQKGYKVYNVQTKTISVSKDVTFRVHLLLHQIANDGKKNYVLKQLFLPTSSKENILRIFEN